jgi:hypothetical protein
MTPLKAAPKKAKAKKPPKKQPGGNPPVFGNVACWEDDPGDPKSVPVLAPILVPAPNQSAAPLPYKMKGAAPAAQVFPVGTPGFLYYAAASALRRTADFWGGIVPGGSSWEVGATLAVDQDSGEDLNAFYTRGDGGDAPGLHFFHDSVGGRVYFSGESPDVACHEMGHAVLDAIRPELFDAQFIEAAAFHEAFGDMSAMLSGLQVPSLRQAVLTETSGKLNRSSRLSRLAEQLGAAIRANHPDSVDADCLRNASNSFFYTDPQTLPPSAPASQLSSEPHSFSRVFSGAFLDALAGMITTLSSPPSVDTLLAASVDAAKILIGGILAAPAVPDYFTQVATQMVLFGDQAPFSGKYRDVLKSAFIRKGILSLQSASNLGQKRGARAMVGQARVSSPKGELGLASIPAAQFGLKQNTLLVHGVADPKHIASSASAMLTGPLEPRSAQSAAQIYTEDIFKRGHVDVGEHSHPETGTRHAFNFKTHAVVEKNGLLQMQRLTFDCGFGNWARG